LNPALKKKEHRLKTRLIGLIQTLIRKSELFCPTYNSTEGVCPARQKPSTIRLPEIDLIPGSRGIKERRWGER